MKQIIFFCVCCLCSFLLTAQQQMPPTKDLPNTKEEYDKEYKSRITKETLFGVYIPKDLADALDILSKKMEPAAKARFIAFTEDEVKIKGALRMWIKNNWGFDGGSRLSQYMKDRGVYHPDDMAEVIMISLHRHLNKKPLDVDGQVKAIQEKRKKQLEDKQKKAVVVKEEVIKKEPKPKN